MASLKIDGELVVAEGTVLDACRQAGVEVPTMCFLNGRVHYTSCMVCVVKDVARGALVPACSAPVAEGMEIETSSDEVMEARRVAIELLLSEHVGECEGLCQRVCPAQIDIPGVIRRIAARDRAGAAALLGASQTVAGLPCEACSGRCEKPCRRSQVDDAVGIRDLMLYAAGALEETPRGGERPRRFNSTFGRLREEEKAVVLQQAADYARVVPAEPAQGMTALEAEREAARCLHCDCRKANACRLRDYAERYGASQARYKPEERAAIEILQQHPEVVYEPGKCIKCGICVRLTEQADEPLGLAFLQRGYDTRVGVPFGEPLSSGLTESAAACVAACPTGALACEERKSD